MILFLLKVPPGADRSGGDDHTVAAHSHVAAVHAMAVKLGLPRLLARPARSGPGASSNHLPGSGPGLQAVHAGPVGRCHPLRSIRDHRGDGLASRQAGCDRGEDGPSAAGAGAKAVADGRSTCRLRRLRARRPHPGKRRFPNTIVTVARKHSHSGCSVPGGYDVGDEVRFPYKYRRLRRG